MQPMSDPRDLSKNELAAQALRSFGELRLCVTGSSMLPAVRPDDQLLIRHCRIEEAGQDDIVLFIRQRRLFAHRVVARSAAHLDYPGRRPGRTRFSGDGERTAGESRPGHPPGGNHRPRIEAGLAGTHGSGTVSPLGNGGAPLHPPARPAGPNGPVTAAAWRSRADICIGGITVGVRSSNEAFLQLLDERYAGFMVHGVSPDYEFDIELTPRGQGSPDDDVRVYRSNGQWRLERGDFRAEWDPAARQGRIRQSANPYSIDTVLRIVHTLVLARQGGFLLHAASAVRNGKAFVFAGASGAGKTTLSRLAPGDADVLSDEISYVRREAGGYYAYGTPFAGELARAGRTCARRWTPSTCSPRARKTASRAWVRPRRRVVS